MNKKLTKSDIKQTNSDKPHLLWYAHTVSEVVTELKSNLKIGLSEKQVEERLQQYGANQLVANERISPLALFLNQFKNILIIILLIATALSGALGHIVEAIAIAVIVLFAVVLGFIQEYRAERAMEALKKLSAPLANVLRDGIEQEVPAETLVPGDIIILSTGDRIPADARLIHTANLKAEEAALTGESVPTEKHSELLYPTDAGLGDRLNIVYSGTSIVYGRGSAIVVATGMQTEFGHIAGMIQGVVREKTPLQKNLDRVGKTLTKIAFVVVMIIIILGVLRDQPLLEIVIFGIALAVAVVPEALPAVVTISLAIGVNRMAKRNALVRHLPAVETLGCTNIICSDKTGTLTKDEMTVRKAFLPPGIILEVTGSGYEPKGEFLFNGKAYPFTEHFRLFLTAASLCTDAKFYKNESEWSIQGDPTEGALVVAAEKVDLHKDLLEKENPRIAEIPFSSESKRMTTLHQTPQGSVAYGKGAVEVILASCSQYYAENEIKPITDDIQNSIINTARLFASEALRVIGVAYKQASDITLSEKDMIFLGFFGLMDPPRPEAKLAIEQCRNAGIKLMMITGDHPETARAVAQELTLLSKKGKVVTGRELAALDSRELAKIAPDISVCARVSPEHKLKLVEALQSRGYIVAMTGDGINDAPALKKANIGIAMGITGTDVTKEAAQITLTDDNFASIVSAVEEGRIIFENIKKYLMYLLSCNFGEIGLMTVATLLGWPLPLSAVQILYVNLATDGLPAIALAVDPPEKDIMQRPPRKHSSGIFSHSVIMLLLAGGLWTTFVTAILYAWSRYSGRSSIECMTMTFISLVLIQFFNAYNFRSVSKSFFSKPFANRWLNRAIIWEIIMLLLVVYLPFMQKPFKTMNLPLIDWVLIAVASFSIVPFLEIVKFFLRRHSNHIG